MANAIEVPAEKIIAALQTLHGQNHQEWAFFTEVVMLGWDSCPRVDAIAVGGWRKSGYRVIAYEVKCTRSDWLRELKDPAKRELAEEVADECWFATAPGVIKDGEVPDGWGHLEVVSTGTRRIVKAAPQRRKDSRPAWFVASMARVIFEKTGSPLAPEDRALWRVAASTKPLTKEQVVALARDLWGDEIQKAKDALRGEREQRSETGGGRADEYVRRMRRALNRAFPDGGLWWGDIDEFCEKVEHEVAKLAAAVAAAGGIERVAMSLAERIAVAEKALDALRSGHVTEGGTSPAPVG
jgi:hypothetical protein